MREKTLISPKFLHKHSAADVLLANPRKVIPSKFSTLVPHSSSDKNIERIYNLYVNSCDNILYFPAKIISNIVGISFETVIKTNDSQENFGVPHQIIDAIYNDSTQHPIKNSLIEDDVIESFLTHYMISQRSTSFSFINYADHYFFYGKQHEHVPGIMFVEAARQAIYYQLYTYSKFRLGEVTVSLSELNAKFYAYGELMYPIEIIVDDLTTENILFPSKLHYSISFYQRGALIAKINSIAPVIKINKFKMARNVYLFNDETFTPLDCAPILSLITSSNMNQEIIQLLQIGKDSCVTSIPKNDILPNSLLTLVYDATLCFRTTLFHPHIEKNAVSWSFGPINYSDLEELKEMIKRGFILCNKSILS